MSIDISPTIEVTIECGACGAELDCDTGEAHGSVFIRADPCTRCLKEAAEEASSVAYDDGYDDGINEGQKDK